jgi:DNA-binding LacI/PurR family transcriptional regulator
MANAPIADVEKVVYGQHDVADDVRARVQNALRLIDSFRLSSNAPSTQRSIGVVVPGQIIDDYVGAVVEGAMAACERYDHALLINVQNPSHGDSLLELVSDSGADGVIAVVPYNYDYLIDLCHRYERPYVLVDHQGDESTINALTVESKNREAIMTVMRHLMDLGHRRIAFITGRLVHASAQQRLQGYRDALKETGISYDPNLVVEGDWQHPAAYELTQQLLRLSDPPTAIVGSNDLSAFGAMQAVEEAGLVVGEQVSITGFDDISMASIVTPALTTVRQPARQMGETAIEMLIKRLNGEPIMEMHVRLDTEFIIRASTGRAP